MRRDRTWVALLLIVLLFAFLAVLFPVVVPRDTAHPFSSDSAGKAGVKAIYELLRERGVDVQKWEDGWNRLPRGPGHMLFIVEPVNQTVNAEARAALKDWVRAGNTVVIWARPGFSLLDELDFTVDQADAGPETVSVAKRSERWLRDIDRLVLPGGSRIGPGEGIEAVLTDRGGRILVARKDLGQGRIFYVPEPEMITNGYIARGDNLALPLYFASFADGTLWFDESARQFPVGEMIAAGEETGPSDLTRWWNTQGIYVLAEALLVLLLWLYVRGKRFAAPRWETVEQFRAPDEFVEGMASLYRSSRLFREALEILERSFRRDAARAVGLSPNVSRDRLLERIAARMGKEAGREVQQLLEELDRARTAKIKEKEMIRLSQAMERSRREIQRWNIKQ